MVLAFVGTALISAAMAGASSSELPLGWWKGTIVLEERWDQIVDNTGVKFSEKGSATVRIARPGSNTAAYDISYRQETRWIGECGGALQYVQTASVKKTAPIDVGFSEQGPGAWFGVNPEIELSVPTEYYECGSTVPEKHDGGTVSARFEFRSKQPDGSRTRRGTGSTVRPVFYGNYSSKKPRPGGVNTSKVTWDLKFVTLPAASKPVKLSGIVLTRPRPSFVYADIRVTQGGYPITPKAVRCSLDFPAVAAFGPRKGPGLWRAGQARCPSAFNNAKYEGETMTGVMEVTVGKKKVKRTYSVRIGPGLALSNAKGAVISSKG
jgi:hypothetical protein